MNYLEVYIVVKKIYKLKLFRVITNKKYLYNVFY